MKRDTLGGRVGSNGWASGLEIRQLRAFLAVVQEGTVSRAATTLGLAQSTVSEALAALDRALGAQTVHRKRGAQHTTLTAAGEALLPHARRTLEALEAAHLSVASVTRSAKARVEVVANESVSTYLLPPVLGALRKNWPRTRFAVSIETCATIRERVAAGRCDLGLLLEEDRTTSQTDSQSPIHDGTVERHDLRRDLQLIIFGGSKHPLTRGGRPRPIGRDALGEFPMFVPDAAGDFHDLLLGYFAADGLRGPRLEAAGTIEGVRRGVAGDPSALGVLPHYALTDDLKVGRAYALTVMPSPPRMQLVALLPPQPASRHPAIAELLERLR